MATFVLLLHSVFFAASDIANGECPDGWTVFRGSCYVFGHTPLTFNEAEEFCVHHGAHLIHINDAVENTFIKSFLSTLKDPKHWIGLKDEVIENIWTWYDTDTVATYTNWGSRQPDQGTYSNCGAIWETFRYDWVDEPCTHQFQAICEKSTKPNNNYRCNQFGYRSDAAYIGVWNESASVDVVG